MQTIFPCKDDRLINHDVIPFSSQLLYDCSESEHPFILFPAITGSGNISLTIDNMRRLLSSGQYDFFNPFPRDPKERAAKFLYEITCEPRWYLISKNVTTVGPMKKFCAEHDYPYGNFKAAPAIVYIYAWVLFKLLRKKTLFLENLLCCRDNYADRKNGPQVYLNFKTGKISFGYWHRPQDGGDNLGIAPSVDPLT